MRSAAVLSLFSAVVLAQELGPAAAISNNPIGAKYVATFPNSVKTEIRGSVTAQSATDGNGVNFDVVVDGLPAEGGPFAFHIHDQPVPADGNCTKTLAHLDPYKRGQATPCDTSNPATCEVGDLSGKHGTMSSPAHNVKFLELYASTMPGIGAFLGNRSVVIHYKNSTRITCANFVAISEGAVSSSAVAYPTAGYPTYATSGAPYPTAPSGAPSPSPNATMTTYASPMPTSTGSETPAPPAETGAATRMFVGSGALLGALVALLL